MSVKRPGQTSTSGSVNTSDAHMKAKDSPQVQKAREKLEKEFDKQDELFTPALMKQIKERIHSQFVGESNLKKRKIITKPAMNIVVKLKERLESPRQTVDKELKGRVSRGAS